MGYRLGINLGFAVNRYIEPEVWTRIVDEELQLRYVQMVADLLNPFWDGTFLKEQIKRIQMHVRIHGITIESLFTSAFTRVNHLMHPDETARAMWYEWFLRFLEIGSEFGARNAGSHFGIMTFDTYGNPDKRKATEENAVILWQKLTSRAKELGYRELVFEPMCVPREMGDTIQAARGLMEKVNADCGVPMKLCLDVGHAPHPSQRDPYHWIDELAKDAPVIHLQQTERDRSNHSPFTEGYNETGIIEKNRLMEHLAGSGCEDALLAFEISHREHSDFEDRIIPDLKESVRYFRDMITD